MRYFFIDLRLHFKNFLAGIRNFWKFRKLIWNYRDWDFGFNLEMEYFQLKLLCNHIEKAQFFEGYEIEIERMKLALYLLNMIIQEEFPKNKYVNTKNSNRFLSYKIKDYKLFKENLYLEKVWNLYHLIRVVHMRKWWE